MWQFQELYGQSTVQSFWTIANTVTPNATSRSYLWSSRVSHQVIKIEGHYFIDQEGNISCTVLHLSF